MSLINTTYGQTILGEPKLSILDSALAAGLVFDYSCKNGQCGICRTTLLDGEVIELQTQVALSGIDRENKQILSCCCAPKTDVLIDAEDLTVLKGIEIKTIPARIKKIVKRTDVVIEVELRLPPAANLSFLEGQYIDVIAHGGVRRSYSIANSSSKNPITLWIKRVDNGQLSQYWFNDAKENDLLRIEGPLGTFFFREALKPAIFLATGTGIAPIKAILDRLDETGSESPFYLYWGNRKPEDFFWRPSYNNLKLKYIPVLSKCSDSWDRDVGYVQDAAIMDHDSLDNIDVYACGSLAMIGSAKELFIKKGLEEKAFYSDAFVSS